MVPSDLPDNENVTRNETDSSHIPSDTQSKDKLIVAQQQRIKELNANYQKIISVISHDVRGPIASLKSVLDLQATKGITDEEFFGLMKILNDQLDITLEVLTNLVHSLRKQMD